VKLDFGATIVAASVVLYAGATAVFVATQRPWLGVMYLGYTIGAVGSVMLALGHK